MNSQPSSTDSPTSPLGAWAWDPALDDYVRASDPLPDEIQDLVGDGGSRHLTQEEFEAILSSEHFREKIAGALNWGGRVSDLQSLQVDEGNAAFREAMAVAYRRLFSGNNALLSKLMSNRDIVDFFILSCWAGPFFTAVGKEIKTKKAAKKIPSPPQPQDQPEAKEKGNE